MSNVEENSLETRQFTYEEANDLLPEIIQITERAVEQAAELLGKAPFEEPLEVEEDKVGELREVLSDWAEQVLELGVEVKGLWLVDFDTGGGYYCWRYPEPALEYFHTYEEGFSGRVAIN